MGLATVFDCQDVSVFDHIKLTQVKLCLYVLLLDFEFSCLKICQSYQVLVRFGDPKRQNIAG